MTQSLATWPAARAALGARFRSGQSRQEQVSDGHALTRLVTLLALAAALVTALVPAGSYLLAEYASLTGALEARSRTLANELARQGWRPQADGSEAYLQRLLQAEGRPRQPEGQRLLRPDGTALSAGAAGPALPAPRLRRRAPVVVEDAVVGQIEVVRSLRPAIIGSALLLLPCTGLGLVVFALLRLLPFRVLAGALRRAEDLAAHDPLTRLPNRAALQDHLQPALQALPQGGAGLALLVIDLDHFKPVNDALGHASGDALLVAVAGRLAEAAGPDTFLARLGGDEFALLQPGATEDVAKALATRLLGQLAPAFPLEGRPVEIGASIGISLARSGDVLTPDQLLQRADIALYRAKQQGRSGFRLFTPEMDREQLERRALEGDLRRALAEGQFRLEYQPLVCLASGEILGAEALLRWHRPGHGNVPPDRFIGVAEEIGMIGPIGAWVLQEACREAARWPAPLGIAVNVSPVQFRQSGLPVTVQAALEQAGLAPERLELEITEGILLRDTPEMLEILRRLRSLGVRLAMDDFGTGYSSLGYLSRFAFDKIKIDRSFVRQLAHDPSSKAIIRAVMGISQTLGIRANAEGVESREQAELLRLEGCAEVQGYLYGRPMPPEQFAALCRQAA